VALYTLAWVAAAADLQPSCRHPRLPGGLEKEQGRHCPFEASYVNKQNTPANKNTSHSSSAMLDVGWYAISIS